MEFRLPFGRRFVREGKDKAGESKGKWEIIPEKQKMIAEIAERYLNGESLMKLCEEFDQSYQNISEALRSRCGEEWYETHNFKGEEIRIRHIVPRLLSEEVIQKVRRRAVLNRKNNGPQKNAYLLKNFVYCEACGYALIGQVASNGRYYRHQTRDGAKHCPLNPRPYVRADDLEERVIEVLFDDFGNIDGARNAIKRAIPNQTELLEARKRLERWEKQHSKLVEKRDRVKQMFEDGDIDRDEKSERMKRLNEKAQ